MHKYLVSALSVAAVLVACPAVAQPEQSTPLVNPEFGVPVFPYDMPDRPYTVVGEVTAGVRKATIFSKAPDQGKVYRELWERGHKLGADAVIKATYGDPHVTAFSWGSVKATGVAVKFIKPADASAVAPAPTPVQ
jgi:hypothetical protein